MGADRSLARPITSPLPQAWRIGHPLHRRRSSYPQLHRPLSRGCGIGKLPEVPAVARRFGGLSAHPGAGPRDRGGAAGPVPDNPRAGLPELSGGQAFGRDNRTPRRRHRRLRGLGQHQGHRSARAAGVFLSTVGDIDDFEDFPNGVIVQAPSYTGQPTGESTMPKRRPPYPPEFRQQMIELVRAVRCRASSGGRSQDPGRQRRPPDLPRFREEMAALRGPFGALAGGFWRSGGRRLTRRRSPVDTRIHEPPIAMEIIWIIPMMAGIVKSRRNARVSQL